MTEFDKNDIIYQPYKEGAKIWHYFLRATGDMEGKFAKCIFEIAEGVCNSILSMGKKPVDEWDDEPSPASPQDC